MCFSANVGRRFLKSNNVGRHFCNGFAQIFRDFARIFDKSKLLGVRLNPGPDLGGIVAIAPLPLTPTKVTLFTRKIAFAILAPVVLSQHCCECEAGLYLISVLITYYFVNTLLLRSSFCYRISRTPIEEANNSLTKIITINELLNLHGI